ncbi:heavy-metal-associated domain-containing protein [Bacillota bacterium LX-D]|nr:heavy-metal-associated domain-containing protein [Bacillota bacterium LX-D]
MSWFMESKLGKEWADLTVPKSEENFAQSIIDLESTITMIVTDMYTEEDYQKIAGELQAMDGIKQISPLLELHRIEICYDTRKISLDRIANCISAQGYHYLNRV